MITRQEIVTQSVTDYVRAQLVARGYPTNQWVLKESFDFTSPPDDLLKDRKQVIACGFDFDSGGEEAEMGSDLKNRVYNLEFVIFGTSATYARNLSSVIKFACDQDTGIPLLDISDPLKPQIDVLTVISARSNRQEIPDPEPWLEYVWLTNVQVEDVYFASLV